ncbi:MAG: SDR family oxidoreductase [Acidimicrobiales bacterium]|nr:SDR family oxidoreductase [Acidimicrobiales bacterium]
MSAAAHPDSVFGLDGRAAIVTGASSGIGAHCARVLAGAGANVLLVARRAERLDALAAELPGARVAAVDLGDPETAATAVERAITGFGRLDVLVNAAGITNTTPASKENVDEFTDVITVNLVAPYALARAAVRAMRETGGGSIVNITSVLADISEPSLPEAGYTASKGGLRSLTRELAVQWARHHVRVNAIAPGWFPTEMTAGLADHDERGPEFARRRVPMGRFGQLEELDGPLLLLASDAGSYITGHTLVVDGGATLI